MRRGSDRGEREDGTDPTSESGQATVEFALVLPVVVLIALIVAQVGLLAKDMLLVHHAAREGARASAVDPTSGAARAGASGAAALDSARLTVTLSGGTSEGDLATTTVVYQAPTDLPLVGALIGDVTMRAAVTMRVE